MRVRYEFPESADRTVLYQRYYLLGLEEQATLRVEGAPLAVRVAPGVTNKLRVHYRIAGGSNEGHVGRYVGELDGGHVRFAIDAHDSRAIRDPEALDWADVYFKSNRWPALEYDAKVLPIVNGNGLVDRRKLRALRGLRAAAKTVDVAYISNVWGGREHSLRVFEQLVGLECSLDLLAIFPAGFPAEEDARNMARLERQGIPVTRTPLRPAELWRRLARARVVPFRAGKHLAFSWRTIDLLGMGACILFDALPPPRWPVPLAAGVHVGDCGISRPPDTEPADEAEYAKLGAEVMRLLERPDEQQALRDRAAAYFDEHAAPARVADYVLATVAAH